MKKTNLTFEEIQTAEKAADDRRKSRKTGFEKMIERDESMHRLSNGVVMLWHVNRDLMYPYISGTDSEGQEYKVYQPTVPEDSFGLSIDGKVYLFNLEEFRRSLRWA